MNIETRELLEKANESLDEAYKNIRIVISDLGEEKTDRMKLWVILNEIDKAKQELEKLLYPAQDIESEIFR
jgi:hypothetical protein